MYKPSKCRILLATKDLFCGQPGNIPGFARSLLDHRSGIVCFATVRLAGTVFPDD